MVTNVTDEGEFLRALKRSRDIRIRITPQGFKCRGLWTCEVNVNSHGWGNIEQLISANS